MKAGRKKNPNGDIIPSSGLYVHQWDRIQRDAALQEISGATLLRRIVDWYYNAIEANEVTYVPPEFEKLDTNQTKPNAQGA